jgi:hypothetical protein
MANETDVRLVNAQRCAYRNYVQELTVPTTRQQSVSEVIPNSAVCALLGKVSMAISEDARRVWTMIDTIITENPHLKPGLFEDTWGYDRIWMVGQVRDTIEVGLPVHTWTHKYLTAMSLGPWRIHRQLYQKNQLLSEVGNAEWSSLTPDAVESLPFALPWQKQQALRFHESLRERASTLDALCDHLRSLTGDDAYRTLAAMSGVTVYSKCLDFFVREALCLDTVPIDRHVRRILARFGLSRVRRSQLTLLIREAGFRPRLIARLLYEQGLEHETDTATPISDCGAQDKREKARSQTVEQELTDTAGEPGSQEPGKLPPVPPRSPDVGMLYDSKGVKVQGVYMPYIRAILWVLYHDVSERLYLPDAIKVAWGVKRMGSTQPHIDRYLNQLASNGLIERELHRGCRITVKGVMYCQQSLEFDPGARR